MKCGAWLRRAAAETRRGAWIVRVLIALAGPALATPAAAVTLVEGTAAKFAWAPSTGPVDGYLVYVSKDGGALTFATYRPAQTPWTAVYGSPGNEFQIAVQPVSSQVIPGPLSPLSETIRFVETLESDPELPAPLAAPAAPMDFDGDGRSDLLLRNAATGMLAIWLIDEATFRALDGPGPLEADQRIVGAADYDGDGYADLLVRDDDAAVLELRYLAGGWLAERGTLGVQGGRRVATSTVFAGEGAASILLHETASGSVDRLDDAGWLRPLAPLPAGLRYGARFVAGLDLDDDGVVEMVYEKSGALIAHTPAGPATGSRALGVLAPEGLVVAGACSLPGPGRDAVLASLPGVGHYRVGFAEGSGAVRVEPVANLDARLARSPGVGAGDFDGDGDCDLLLQDGKGVLWLALLEGSWTVSARPLGAPGADWEPVGVGAEAPPDAP